MADTTDRKPIYAPEEKRDRREAMKEAVIKADTGTSHAPREVEASPVEECLIRLKTASGVLLGKLELVLTPLATGENPPPEPPTCPLLEALNLVQDDLSEILNRLEL